MNFITVQEAKKKLCPIMMLSEHPQVGSCEASMCMMWRWDPQLYFEGDSNQPTKRGYCGLAGLPNREGGP